MPSDLQEIAKQAAREAVARRYELAGAGIAPDCWQQMTADIRAGKRDDIADVEYGIQCALAAAEAVRAATVRECAAVARTKADEQRREAAGFRQDMRKAFTCRALGAEITASAILALAPQEDKST